MKRTILTVFAISISLLLTAAAFPEEPSSGQGDGQKELVTPRGTVYVGMPEKMLYTIYREDDRILIPHAILSNEWHVFRDFTSKDPNDTITFFITAGEVTGWKKGYAPTPENQGSEYAYDHNENIPVWFFPENKAKWDGMKVSLLDWNKLTEAQKIMYLKEYIAKLDKEYNVNMDINIDKYIIGMNFFNDNCPDECKNIMAWEAINTLLVSDGKATPAR